MKKCGRALERCIGELFFGHKKTRRVRVFISVDYNRFHLRINAVRRESSLRKMNSKIENDQSDEPP